MIKWNFSLKNEPGRTLLDSFSDSKFNINCVASFTREIIQNSLDAKNKEINDPVEVKFEVKKIKANDIPGISDLINVLEKSLLNLTHNETINKFKKAIEQLKQPEVEVLKISDFNTLGMSKKSWEALLFTEGVSSKQDDSSAGRHGIGKKASFLMSLCNTVYYSTKNTNGEMFFGGKSILVDWKESADNNNWRSGTGWYGEQEENNIKYLENEELNKINNYFVRKDEVGSDVIVLTPRIFDENYNLEKQIINSVLENFYIGLCENRIIVKINDTEINSKNVNTILDEYYVDKFIKQGITGSNITYGLLKDFKTAYIENKENPIVIDIPKLNSYLDLYITLNTEKTKKYYSFYREHGMKIKDVRVSEADKTFAAIVVARGKEINEFLLSLENAAHDDFIVDENMSVQERKNKQNILDDIKERILRKIKEFTKLELSDEIELDELNDIINNPGEISRKAPKKANKKTNNKPEGKIVIQTKSNKKIDEKWNERIKPLDPIPVDPVPEPDNIVHHPRPLPYPMENEEEEEEEKKSLREVAYDKMLVTLQDCYYMQFVCGYNLKRVAIQITAKNVDDTENDVSYMLNEIKWNNKIYYNKGNNYIELGDLPAFEEMKLFITLKESPRYKLFARIVGKTYE